MGLNSNRVEDFSSHENTVVRIQVPEALNPSMEIHKVCLPPKQTTFQKFKRRVSEIFFPDNPLHGFRNQTSSLKKLLLGLQFFLPIFQWGPHYNVGLLKSDIISGLTIASLAIPQGISYAKLANLPPIVGLYSSFVPPLIYSLLGSSRHLAVGPVSIASLVMGSMLSEAVSPTGDPILYLKLAFTSTFFAGVFQASLGILRLGFIIDFLSKATLVGFMAGAAVIVSLQQLKRQSPLYNITKGVLKEEKTMLRKFQLEEVVKATNNFSRECLLGSGAYGNVYKGTFDVQATLAIKRPHTHSYQSVEEFRNEVGLLSK